MFHHSTHVNLAYFIVLHCCQAGDYSTQRKVLNNSPVVLLVWVKYLPALLRPVSRTSLVDLSLMFTEHHSKDVDKIWLKFLCQVTSMMLVLGFFIMQTFGVLSIIFAWIK